MSDFSTSFCFRARLMKNKSLKKLENYVEVRDAQSLLQVQTIQIGAFIWFFLLYLLLLKLDFEKDYLQKLFSSSTFVFTTAFFERKSLIETKSTSSWFERYSNKNYFFSKIWTKNHWASWVRKVKQITIRPKLAMNWRLN